LNLRFGSSAFLDRPPSVTLRKKKKKQSRKISLQLLPRLFRYGWEKRGKKKEKKKRGACVPLSRSCKREKKNSADSSTPSWERASMLEGIRRKREKERKEKREKAPSKILHPLAIWRKNGGPR